MNLYVKMKYVSPAMYNTDFPVEIEKDTYIYKFHLVKHKEFPYKLSPFIKLVHRRRDLTADEEDAFFDKIIRYIRQLDKKTIDVSVKKCSSVSLSNNYGKNGRKFSSYINIFHPIVITFIGDNACVECFLYVKSFRKLNINIRTSVAVNSYKFTFLF